jgi:SAM-dependent MidA family methyltransferase
MNILDYLRDEHPEVYDRTRYNIIEISATLAENQKKRLGKAHPCVTVNHKSALHWDTKEPAPCYFIAMEVVVSLFFAAASVYFTLLHRITSPMTPFGMT